MNVIPSASMLILNYIFCYISIIYKMIDFNIHEKNLRLCSVINNTLKNNKSVDAEMIRHYRIIFIQCEIIMSYEHTT